MGIVFENSLHVSPENLIVIDYLKKEKPHTMPLMHYHPYYEIYILLSGKRKYFFHNKIIELYPHDVLIVKPNEAHRAIPLDNVPYERYIINIDPSLFNQIAKYNKHIKESVQKEIFHLDEDTLQQILNIIGCIEKEKTKKQKNYIFSIRNYIERILLDLPIFTSNIIRPNQLKKNDIRLQATLDYINVNYQERISLEKCAAISSMSKSNFARVFHDIIGINLKEFVNSVRIQKSCEFLIGTNMTISEISEAVGYDSLSYFCLKFRTHTNLSPNEYRNRYSNK